MLVPSFVHFELEWINYTKIDKLYQSLTVMLYLRNQLISVCLRVHYFAQTSHFICKPEYKVVL